MQLADPLPRAYSHRDCELRPPLWHSLRHGFTHIEADVYYLFGRVYVAHDLQQLRPWRTLERLYLEPLRQHLEANGGRIFTEATPLHLFVDIKTPAESSYRALHALLERYQDMLTTFGSQGVRENPVTVIVSGNRLAYTDFKNLPLRYAALDGRLEDLGVHTDPQVMPVISDNWRKIFRWQGSGPMPADEQTALETMLATAHRHGQKLRFWATPDRVTPERFTVWDKLLTLGIDLVNTDDVTGLARYLKTRR